MSLGFPGSGAVLAALFAAPPAGAAGSGEAFSGPAAQVAAGIAGGVILGLAGRFFAARAANPARPAASSQKWWAFGMLARLALLVGLLLSFRLAWPEDPSRPALTLAGAYLVLHFLGIRRLCRIAGRQTAGEGARSD